MDKLKEQLAPVQKHLFWIGCGLILAVTLFSWYRATSHLKAEHTTLKGEIDNAYNTVSSVKGKTNHPNDNTLKGMDALIKEIGEKVAARWADLARNQENVLVWPTYAFDEQFIDQVKPLRPPELTVTDGVNEISIENKRVYRDHVEKVFPELAKIVGATWNGKVSAGGGGGGGMMGMPGGDMAAAMMNAAPPAGGGGRQAEEADNSIVQWNSSNQSDLMNEHFKFIASDAGTPSTRQILYAQEDLWVLENLLKIVKATNETNGPIEHRHEAAIKTIDAIQIGRAAVNESGKVSPIGKAGSDGGGMEGAPGMMMPGGGDMMANMMNAMTAGGGDGMEPGAGDPGGAAAPPGGAATPMPAAGGGNNLADNRYVDRDYQGVAASRLISAMKGEATNPEDLILAVAKRVPVRMVLKMDQRRTPTLLAECGNSKLPVEVKQIRVNRQSSTGGGGGMMGGMMGMMPGADAGPGGDMESMMMGGQFGGGPTRKSTADSSVDPNEISVELYGIVYIYNPVNRAVLGLKDESPVPPAVVTPTGTTPSTPPVNTGAAVPTSATPVN